MVLFYSSKKGEALKETTARRSNAAAAMSAGHRAESVKLLFSLALLSCSHSPETSPRSGCVIHEAAVSFRPYVLARPFLQARTRPHIHELVFSLCPYAVWCCAAVLLPTNRPFHCSPNKTETVTLTPHPPD